MRILLLTSAYNSMTQRVHAELADRGHEVSVELALSDEVMREGVRRYDPDLVIAPMLTAAIPADIWSARPCFIVHPGPVGDRGPSSLDWAIMDGAGHWGVTVLQANAEMDAGDIWAGAEFTMPGCSKSSLYRTEVADAAAAAVLLAVARFAAGSYRPEPLDYRRPGVPGRFRPPCRQPDRKIDWATEPTWSVLAKLRAADSSPGVLDVIDDTEYYLIGGHPDDELRGAPGTILAWRDGAVCRATADGAVWIPQLRRRPEPGGAKTFKLPATLALDGVLHGGLDRGLDGGLGGGPRGGLAGVPEVPVPLRLPPGQRTYRQIGYRESGGVGYLEFCFPGGAMSTGQCRRLLAAYRYAQARPVRVIVLGGPRDFFGNGIHLNVIQAAADPAEESWRNINAIDDLVQAILTTTDKLTVAALAGNAAAGGLMLALAADQVWCRSGAVLNPHYRLMGLHGSEYWTYTLPRRVGSQEAARLTQACLPVSPASALRSGLVDRVIAGEVAGYRAQVTALAEQLARSPDYPARLAAKARQLAAAEKQRPLAAYRADELAIMSRNFSGPREPYAQLRRAFVYKEKPAHTPPHLARHRTHPWPSRPGRPRAMAGVPVRLAGAGRGDGDPGYHHSVRLSRDRAPVTSTDIPALLRHGASAIAAMRVALGLTVLAWPSVAARPWVGEGDLAVRVFGRALGGRDLALGLGALTTLQNPAAEPGSASAWVAAGALSDALDVVASLSSWRELPRVGRWLVVASSGGAAVAGAAGALAVRPNRSGSRDASVSLVT